MLDYKAILSDNQAITATAPSTNVYDLGKPSAVGYRPAGISGNLNQHVGRGMCVPLLVQISEAFDNLTSLTIKIQGCDAEGFGTGIVDYDSIVVPLAGLTLGAKIHQLDELPKEFKERYVRLHYTVTGTPPTAGKVLAGFVEDLSDNSGGGNVH